MGTALRIRTRASFAFPSCRRHPEVGVSAFWVLPRLARLLFVLFVGSPRQLDVGAVGALCREIDCLLPRPRRPSLAMTGRELVERRVRAPFGLEYRDEAAE